MALVWRQPPEPVDAVVLGSMLFDGMLGGSKAMQNLFASVQQVAPTDATVLIEGETGTGKELVANAIHARSRRARGPLVKFNCAAIPETLLAAELFGYERGAFTGAVQRRPGRFEQANHGTLFLDEIGELSREAQVMLLRVLQERELQRLGGLTTVPVDVRILAATNRDLAGDVASGCFRSDLYYRLNVFPLRLPALRDRAEDIPSLVRYFARKHAARLNRNILGIDETCLRRLQSAPWPGNVRELENVVERAVIVSTDGVLRVEAEQSRTSSPARAATWERETIEAALGDAHGRIAGPNGAARMLGVPPSTLELHIRRMGIDKFRYRSPQLSLAAR